MDHLDLEAPGLTAGNVEKIAALFPAAVTETQGADGKVKKAVNFEVLKQLLAPDVAEGEDRYEFTWVGKRAAMAEAARPTSRTLRPVKADSRDWDTTRNLYIEGDNLEVLKILQESYLGAVKVIYLDPPYNTGSDFIYPDSFVMDRGAYHGASGYRDAEGKINFQRKNTFSDGRYHSDWCSMLFSRLLLARSLLSPDGVILISIDDHESANLKKICDEVFGESNYLNQFAWVSNITGRQISGRGAAKTWESVLAYARDIAACGSLSNDIRFAREKMPDAYKGFRRDVRTDRLGPFAVGDPLYNHNRKFNEETRPNLVFSIFYQPQTQEISTGAIGERRPGWFELPPHANGDGVHKYHAWRWSRQKIADEPYNLIVLPTASGGYEIHTKIRDFGRTLLKDVIPDIPNGDAELRKLFGGRKLFDYPKSVDLLRTLIGSVPGKDFVCLDLFSGSATTAHAVMQLNAEDGGHRRFILCTNNENGICREITYERIRRVIETENYAASLRYFRVEHLPVENRLYDEYAFELLHHIEPLTALERQKSLADEEKIGIAPDDQALEELLADKNRLSKLRALYLGGYILLSQEQQELLTRHGIRVRFVPDTYYDAFSL